MLQFLVIINCTVCERVKTFFLSALKRKIKIILILFKSFIHCGHKIFSVVVLILILLQSMCLFLANQVKTFFLSALKRKIKIILILFKSFIHCGHKIFSVVVLILILLQSMCLFLANQDERHLLQFP